MEKEGGEVMDESADFREEDCEIVVYNHAVAWAWYGMDITHLPTGITVNGFSMSQIHLRQKLMERLEEQVTVAVLTTPPLCEIL